jgi:N-acetylneuraminate synthase/N,N'-diacetyllegionaminate synthase
MQIGQKTVDDGNPFFIAEAGVNHNGDLSMAIELIDVAAAAGADAVKFQTFSADRLVKKDTTKADYQQETSGAGTQHEMLKNYELDHADHVRLQEYCDNHDILFLSTPFDTESADLLADLGVPAFKIGSGELDNDPFFQHVAEYGIPMIVSTGMGTMSEIRAARDVIRDIDPDVELCFLHCTSEYPCYIDDVNLRSMERMNQVLDVPVGYSDHTTHPEMPSLAIAAGAYVVEKHFTLDNSLPGPDHEASLEPEDLARAVELSRLAARSRGSAEKRPTEKELRNRSIIRKSVHAAGNLSSGESLSPKDIEILRPADGLSPRRYQDIIGTELATDISAGAPITAEDIVDDFGSEDDV